MTVEEINKICDSVPPNQSPYIGVNTHKLQRSIQKLTSLSQSKDIPEIDRLLAENALQTWRKQWKELYALIRHKCAILYRIEKLLDNSPELKNEMIAVDAKLLAMNNQTENASKKVETAIKVIQTRRTALELGQDHWKQLKQKAKLSQAIPKPENHE